MKTLCDFKKIVSYSKSFMRKIWAHPKVRKGFKTDNRQVKDTKEMYLVEGYKYSQKRYAMHMKIVNRIMEQTSPPQKGKKPMAILVGGGSASGKTTLREMIIEKKLVKIDGEAVKVDPDEIKEYIPEYQSWKKNDPNNAARLVHKESRDIGDLLLKKIIHNRKNFIYEGTMSRTQKYKKLIKRLKKDGYKVHVYIVDIPLELAKQRADERAKVTGRNIPVYVIENTHKLVPKTFEAIKNLVDSYHIYNNQQELMLIASNHYVKPTLYNEFLKKGKRSKKILPKY